MGIEHNKVNHEIFNVRFCKAIDVVSVADELVKAYCSSSKITITENYGFSDIRDNYDGLAKMKSQLGFEKKISFGAGINMFVEWVNSQ